MEPILQAFGERIAAAAAAGSPLRLRGGGSKDWYGQDLRGEIFDTRAFTGITAYDPTELVITARCGTPLSDVEAALAERGQMLAFEPPRFGDDSTVGGMVAAGLSGPRRASAGALRDFVLGAVLMDGRGQVLHFGGQVMKNVAGYDVSRLLTGSLGTLGLVLQVSLKVLPKPAAEHSLCFAMSEEQAIEQLNRWAGQPLPLSASCWFDGRLSVRLSGAEAAVAAARRKLGGENLADSEAFWTSLRDQRLPFFLEPGPLWRLAVPPATPPLLGAQLIEWGGGQRWLRGGGDAAAVRGAVQAAGGHATLFREAGAASVFHPLTPAVAAIHRNLKKFFDPAGIFNRGRMYADF